MSIKTIIIILSLLTSVGIIWQLILPAYSDVKAKQEMLEQKKVELQKLEELINQMNELMSVYKEKETEIEKVSQILPEGKDIPGLLVQVESLAAQFGLILDSIDFSEIEAQKQPQGAVEWREGASSPELGEKKTEPPYKTLSVALRITGNYEAFKNFLLSLENNLRLIDVQTISFTPKGEASDIFDFSLSGEAYYQ